MTTALEASLLNKQDWTVDDLESLPEDLRYELINGRLVLPSPTAMHQHFGRLVCNALEVNCPVGFLPVTDLSVRANFTNEPRPDVVVIDRKVVKRTPVPVADAILAVEIVSPTSGDNDYGAKPDIYASSGIAFYWVIDPGVRSGVTLTEYRLGDHGIYKQVNVTDAVFTTDLPYPVTIDLPEFTAFRDED